MILFYLFSAVSKYIYAGHIWVGDPRIIAWTIIIPEISTCIPNDHVVMHAVKLLMACQYGEPRYG